MVSLCRRWWDSVGPVIHLGGLQGVVALKCALKRLNLVIRRVSTSASPSVLSRSPGHNDYSDLTGVMAGRVAAFGAVRHSKTTPVLERLHREQHVGAFLEVAQRIYSGGMRRGSATDLLQAGRRCFRGSAIELLELPGISVGIGNTEADNESAVHRVPVRALLQLDPDLNVDVGRGGLHSGDHAGPSRYSLTARNTASSSS
jgi:hypothetical protein